MLNIFTAKNLHTLAAQLLQQRDAATSQNLLLPEMYVVQNHGMAQWLSLYIAEEEGIAANIEYKFPAEIFWQIVRVMNPSIPQTLPSEREPMRWALMHILKNHSDPSLNTIQQYINRGDSQKNEVRRWQLSGRIANVFDQYLTFRPAMLLKWEDHSLIHNTDSERWQATLWRKLNEHWKKKAETMVNHRAEIWQALCKAMNEQQVDSHSLPSAINIFGVSSMPPMYINMLVNLSRVIDISFYTMAGQVNECNPLVESMGQSGADFLSLLDEAAKKEADSAINRTDVPVQSRSDSLNLFQQLKKDIQNESAKSSRPQYDHSLQVHSCHSRRREVEVLHDQLLAMLDHDKSLNPADIMVLAPEMGAYAAAIEAVFGMEREAVPTVPFYLSERSHTNTEYQAFIALTDLIQSRFKVTDVLDVLSYRCIRQKFEFSDQDLTTLEKWIDENQIRWGINAPHKSTMDVPPSDHFTWQAGLNRIMLGYTLKPDGTNLYRGIFPYKEIERSEDAALAGRFSTCMQALFEFCNNVRQPQSLDDWSALLLHLLDDFFEDDDRHFKAVQHIRTIILELEKNADLSEFHEVISFQLIHSWLVEQLESPTTGGGSGRGVTFSSLTDMRKIPARCIALLGMSDESFPGSKPSITFDLINKYSQKGDRVQSKDDRHVFLETILAAQEHLYISYIGKSERRDTDLPPSVVVQELLDYITNTYDIAEDAILTKHKLQAFSPAYFNNHAENNLFSYSQINQNVARSLMQTDGTTTPLFMDGVYRTQNESSTSFVVPPHCAQTDVVLSAAQRSRNIDDISKPSTNDSLPDPEESFKRLTIHELVRFFSHPAKYVLQNRFGVYLQEDNILDEDREPLSLGGLQGYALGQELLEGYLNDQAVEEYHQMAESRGMMPEGWPGAQAFDDKAKQVQYFGSVVEQLLEEKKLAPAEVDVEINGFKLTGRLQEIYESKQVFYRLGSQRPKDLIKLWINHLMLHMTEDKTYPRTSVLYTLNDNKNGVAIHRLKAVEDAPKILEDLLIQYWAALKGPFVFFPRMSFVYAEQKLEKDKNTDQALGKAQKQWKNPYVPFPLEGDDTYNFYTYGSSNPLESNKLASKFKGNSISFWASVLQHYKMEER